jgi:hypothetical protein
VMRWPCCRSRGAPLPGRRHARAERRSRSRGGAFTRIVGGERAARPVRRIGAGAIPPPRGHGFRRGRDGRGCGYRGPDPGPGGGRCSARRPDVSGPGERRHGVRFWNGRAGGRGNGDRRDAAGRDDAERRGPPERPARAAALEAAPPRPAIPGGAVLRTRV